MNCYGWAAHGAASGSSGDLLGMGSGAGSSGDLLRMGCGAGSRGDLLGMGCGAGPSGFQALLAGVGCPSSFCPLASEEHLSLVSSSGLFSLCIVLFSL